MLRKIGKVTRDLQGELGRPPTAEEIAERLEMKPDKLRFLQERSIPAMSIEAETQGRQKKGSGGSVMHVRIEDSIRDDTTPCPTQIADSQMLKKDVEQLIGTLNAREQDVIRMRFGLDSGKPKTLEEIGTIFSVSRERVRQIEMRALERLRKPYRNYKLREQLM